MNEENQQPCIGWSALTYNTLYYQSRSPRWKNDVMHIKRRSICLWHFRHDTRTESPRYITGITHWKRRVRRLRAGDGAARRIAAPRVQWRAPLYAYERSGRGWLLPIDTTSWSRAATTRAIFPRLSFARDLQLRGWWHRSRGSNESHVSRSRQRRAIIRRRPPPRAAQHDRPAAGRRRGTCMFVCVYVYLDKRVRNASLAIYVLRHTSSLALAPTAHPPGFNDPSRDPSGEAARPVRQILSPSTTTRQHRAMSPPHRRTDRFAVPSASVAATIGRGCVRHRTIRRQSIVIQFQARRIPSSGLQRSFSCSSKSRKKCPQCFGNTVAFIDSFTTWQRTL